MADEALSTETTEAVAGTTEAAPASADPKTLLTGEATAGNQEQPPATTDQKAEDKPAEGSEETAEIEYQFTFEDGLEVDETVLGDLKGLAKELGLTQEQAQKVANLGAVQSLRWQEAQQKVLADAEASWIEASKTDKEFGGDKLPENLAVAAKALEKFGTPELKQFLEESRLGSHPEVIRMFNRVGKAIADDSVVPGGRSTNGAASNPFYDNSDHR